MPIENLSKGAIPDPRDERDYKAELVMGLPPKIDWSVEFRLPEPPGTDQAESDSCVGHAWSYYHWQLNGEKYSIRSIFAYIAQAYGASIRDGGLRIVNNGQETHEEAPDPVPQTAINMRSKEGLNENLALDDKEQNSYVLPDQQLNYLAQAIKDYKGFVFGVTGSNVGWKDLKVPEYPKPGEETWGHAIYAFGYHTHSDGQKCIIAKSSWKEVNEHHIRGNYFASGNVFNAWVLIPRENKPMYKKVVKQDGKTFGVLIQTPNGDQIIYATSEEQWRSWNKPDSYQLNTVNADGSTNWLLVDCIQLTW